MTDDQQPDQSFTGPTPEQVEKAKQANVANIFRKLKAGKTLSADERQQLEEFTKPEEKGVRRFRKFGPGRRALLSRPLIKRLCQYISEGNTRKTAANLCGVGESTLYKWLGEADLGKPLALELVEALKRADSEAEQFMVSIIRKATFDNWTAAAWFLERRHPGAWARQDRTKVELTGNDGEPVAIKAETTVETKFDIDTYTKLAATLLALPRTDGVAEPVHPALPDTKASRVP